MAGVIRERFWGNKRNGVILAGYEYGLNIMLISTNERFTKNDMNDVIRG